MNRIYLLLLLAAPLFTSLRSLRRFAGRTRQSDLRKYSAGAARARREIGRLSQCAPGHAARLVAQGTIADRHALRRCRSAALVGTGGRHAPSTDIPARTDHAGRVFAGPRARRLRVSQGLGRQRKYPDLLPTPRRCGREVVDRRQVHERCAAMVQQRARSRLLQQRSRWPKFRHRHRGSGIGRIAAPCTVGRRQRRRVVGARLVARRFETAGAQGSVGLPKGICTSWT